MKNFYVGQTKNNTRAKQVVMSRLAFNLPPTYIRIEKLKIF